MEIDFREQNRAMWDERVPIHLNSAFYDVPGFKAGRSSLQPFEPGELGPVAGKELVHLQCHIGLDTLSWARLGAKVTGLDFSEPAVEAARGLARELELDARFVCADVLEASARLGQQFDVVYTGIGALVWLDDLAAWAQVVARLLRPGGTFYIVECHPLTDIFADETLAVENDYFHNPKGTLYEGAGSYADASASTLVNRAVSFSHPLSDVLSCLLQQGLELELFREYDHTAYARWPFLECHGKGCYRLPSGMPRLPLLYSLKLRKK